MPSNPRDYSVLDKFNFEYKPIGVKYAVTRPEGVKPLAKELNFCEMIKEAQENDAFYVEPDNWHCVEPFVLGFEDPEPILVSGLFGGDEGLFKENRACSRMYHFIPKMLKGSVKYVALSPIDKIPFDPDVMVITANIHQAQTLLRSINYSTGEPFQSKATPVVACSWMMVYPVISGEMNYYITGLGMGMQSLNIFPPGLFLISFPWNKIPTMLENLEEMPYRDGPAPPGPGGDAHRKRVNQLMKDLRAKIAE